MVLNSVALKVLKLKQHGADNLASASRIRGNFREAGAGGSNPFSPTNSFKGLAVALVNLAPSILARSFGSDRVVYKHADRLSGGGKIGCRIL